jgi:hypothetical protein
MGQVQNPQNSGRENDAGATSRLKRAHLRMVVSRVSTVRAIRGPQKRFANLASFRPVETESEMVLL